MSRKATLSLGFIETTKLAEDGSRLSQRWPQSCFLLAAFDDRSGSVGQSAREGWVIAVALRCGWKPTGWFLSSEIRMAKNRFIGGTRIGRSRTWRHFFLAFLVGTRLLNSAAYPGLSTASKRTISRSWGSLVLQVTIKSTIPDSPAAGFRFSAGQPFRSRPLLAEENQHSRKGMQIGNR